MVKLKNKVKYALYGAISMLAVCSLGYLGYSHVQNQFIPTHISASSSLYQKVRKNDLHYLHKVGNREAELANSQAYHLNFAQERRDHNSDYTGKYPIYHHDKHGNYWSWFENHQAVGNDVFGIEQSHNNSTCVYGTKSQSGILANEAVLRNHGVHSGVNFYYY